MFQNSNVKTSKLPYYNSIDMGICLCFLEITMIQKGYEFGRTLNAEENSRSELIEIVAYNIK